MALIAQSNASDLLAELRHELEELRAKYATLLHETSTLRSGGNAKPNRPKLTAADVAHIRELAGQPGWSQANIALVYDINPATVSRIVRHKYHP